MNTFKLITVILFAVLLSLSQSNAQKKAETTGVNPKFHQFWKEFVKIVEKEQWRLRELTYFPFIDAYIDSFNEFSGEATPLTRALFNNYFQFNKNEINAIKKVKLNAHLTLKTKTNETFKITYSLEEKEEFNYYRVDKKYIITEKDEDSNIVNYIDYGQHIPDGTPLYIVSLEIGDYGGELIFSKIDGQIYFVSKKIFYA